MIELNITTEMKQYLMLILGLMISLSGFSKSFRVGDFEYEIKKNSLYPNGVILRKDLSKNSNVEIPDFVYYEGTKYTVENIGTNAFKNNDNISSITVPGSVYFIDIFAFDNLKLLKSLTFLPTKMEQEIILKKNQPKDQIFSEYSPNLIVSIGAFQNCESLDSIDLSNRRVFIFAMGQNGGAFRNCKSLRSIRFQDVGFSRDDKKIFKGCHALQQFITGTKNPSKYKKFFELDSPFITHIYPNISSMSDEEYIAYLNQDDKTDKEEEYEVTQIGNFEKIVEKDENNYKNQKLRLSEDIMTVPMQRKDLNGNVCALLKVMVDKKGLTFEGNVVGAVEHNTRNQYWVYVSPGTKKVRINVPGEKPNILNLDEYNDFKTFESKRIYEYSLETTPTQRMNLTYYPTEATILIDGNLYDGKNGEVHAELPLGEHSYMVVAKGFVTSEGIVKLTSRGETSIVVNLSSVEE